MNYADILISFDKLQQTCQDLSLVAAHPHQGWDDMTQFISLSAGNS